MATMAGSLSKTFNHAVKAAGIVAGFVVGGYIGSMLFDPFFFPIIHDPTNMMGQAIKAFMTDHFGFVHEWMGMTGDGGLLHMDPFKTLLEPYFPQAAAASAAASMPAEISADDILNLSGG